MLPLMDAPVCEYLRETTVRRLKERNKRKQPSLKGKREASEAASKRKRKASNEAFPSPPALPGAAPSAKRAKAE